MANHRRTRFNRLEARIRMETFLAAAGRQDDPLARAVTQTVYGIMDQLEWPDGTWEFETKWRGQPRYFFYDEDGRIGNIGVVLLLTVAGLDASLRVTFAMHEIEKHPTYRFSVDGTRVGDFDVVDATSLSLLTTAFEDAIVEIAAKKLAQPA